MIFILKISQSISIIIVYNSESRNFVLKRIQLINKKKYQYVYIIKIQKIGKIVPLKFLFVSQLIAQI